MILPSKNLRLLEPDNLMCVQYILNCFLHADLPDLVPDVDQLYSSLRNFPTIDRKTVRSLQCAIEENCLASDAARAPSNQVRKLLRFDSLTMNYGKADFRPLLDPSQWIYHDCHRHYHSFEIFVQYDLFHHDGREAAEGHKASFCLEDSICPRAPAKKYECFRRVQGITAGCGDYYGRTLDCQWIDVTNVRDGSYLLQVSVNPQRDPEEADYSNNVATCNIVIQSNGARIGVESCSLSGMS